MPAKGWNHVSARLLTMLSCLPVDGYPSFFSVGFHSVFFPQLIGGASCTPAVDAIGAFPLEGSFIMPALP